MKKILIFLFGCLLFLCACSNQRKEKATASPVISPDITTGPSVEIDYKEDDTEEEIEIKKQNTSDLMKNVNIKNKEKDIIGFSCPADYAQISEGHYYYMRMVDDNKYTIYRDKGEKVGSFDIGDDWLDGIIKYKSKFYVSLGNEIEYLPNGIVKKLAVVDFSTTSVKILCEYLFNADDKFTFYNDTIFYYGDPDFENQDFTYSKIFAMDLNGRKISAIHYPNHKDDEYIWGEQIIDGKFYYLKTDRDDGEIYGFRKDIVEGKEEMLFRVQPTLNNPDDIENIYFQFERDGIYWVDTNSPQEDRYKIITTDGKMKKIKSKKQKKYDRYDMIYHAPFYFYIDERNRIHRWDKETDHDKVISPIKAMEIHCTKQGLFVRQYDERWEDPDRDEDIANAVYYMDFNGKNSKMIAKKR